MRVNFYIDGFNFYYGLKDKRWKKYYWLDMVAFCNSFLKEGQKLNEVLYCTAVPKNEGKKNRQDLFFSANNVNPQFRLIFGKYIEKNKMIHGKPFRTYEEKQTDVNIAVEMIRNVVFDRCDVSILVSADSDLIPPINLIRELDKSHKVFVYFPPNRYSADLNNHADNVLKLNRFEQRFKNNLLPDDVALKNGFLAKRPESWK